MHEHRAGNATGAGDQWMAAGSPGMTAVVAAGAVRHAVAGSSDRAAP
ncbi:hypothetical protein AB0C69_21355 [Actinomadura sp. NPDC048032]